MRLFIALQFDETFKAALSKLTAQLKAQGCSGNFTRSENLHLTLCFIGESDRLSTIQRVMDRVTLPPFSIKLQGSGKFRDVWYAAVQESGALSQLALQLQSGLLAAEISVDRKPFKPHITIARKIETTRAVRLNVPPAQTRVQSISLLQSENTGGKLTYTSRYEKQLI